MCILSFRHIINYFEYEFDEFKYSILGVFSITKYLFKVRLLLDQIYLIEKKPDTDTCHHCVKTKRMTSLQSFFYRNTRQHI